MKKLILVIYGLLALATMMNAQQNNFPKLSGDYLGQQPPGKTPETFAPGIISTKGSNEFCASFSPDGSEFYFNRGMTIMVCRLQKEGWTAPEPASFNERYRGHEAHLAFDNKRMFFGSARPPQPYGIWLTERTSTGWSEPRRMWDGMYATLVKNGHIYYGVEFPSPAHIVMTMLVDTGYVSPIKQAIEFADPKLESRSIFHPAIAPDESFLIFDDNKGLYVSFKENDGLWGKAISLSNSLKEHDATIPAISPDGEYLFYASQGDLYWVSNRILEKLRPLMKSPDASASSEGESKEKRERNDDLVLTILYDNKSLDDLIVADHGFSCLIESGGRACLFDAGRIADKFMVNVEKLGVDYSKIDQVFLSHIHDDHMGGLFEILAQCDKPTLYLPFTYPHLRAEPLGEQADRDFDAWLERLKPLVAEIVRKKESVKVANRYYTTGMIEDETYEQALIVPTSKGLIIITGCAHPGILEIVMHAKALMNQEIYFVLGGFHLIRADSMQVKTIAQKLRKLTKYIGPCHCTGEGAQAIFKDIFKEDYIEIRAGLKLKLGDGKLLLAQQNAYQKLTAPYINQKLPGTTPEKFAPGIVSKEGIQSKLLIAPDGSEIIFKNMTSEGNSPTTRKISFVSIKMKNDTWHQPIDIPFSLAYVNDEPTLSPDDKTLFFVSNRPKAGSNEPQKMPDIWMVVRTSEGWDEPRNVGGPVNTDGIEAQPFYSTDDKLYFGRQDGIYYSHFVNEQFSNPVKLDENIFNGRLRGVCLSPDNKILIVHSDKPGGFGGWDLYFSKRNEMGEWIELKNMGNIINTDQSEANATFSPDGKYLFFSRGDDIYWVSVKIIDELRPKD